MMVFWLAATLYAANLPLQPVRSFDETPPEMDIFLQQPIDAVLDEAGNLYVLDVEASRVFVWNADGSFKTVIGKEGQGPGEFSFRARWGPSRGYLGIAGDELKVYARGQRSVSRFGLGDYQYKDSVRFENTRGLELGFEMLKDGTYLMLMRSRDEDAFKVTLAFFNESGQRGKVLAENEDETIDFSGDRNNRKLTFKAYEPSYVTAFNEEREEILVGHSAKPTLTFYNLKGDQTGEIKFDVPRREVTQADRDEYDTVLARRGSGRITIEATYPDIHPFFQSILPLQDKGFLIYSLSPELGILRGYVLDRKGKTLGRVEKTLGEFSSIHYTRGKIIAIQTNEEGDFLIEEMAQSIPKS
jgi:hypothetical protein